MFIIQKSLILKITPKGGPSYVKNMDVMSDLAGMPVSFQVTHDSYNQNSIYQLQGAPDRTRAPSLYGTNTSPKPKKVASVSPNFEGGYVSHDMIA